MDKSFCVGSVPLRSRRSGFLAGAVVTVLGAFLVSFVPSAAAAAKAPQVVKIEAGAVRYEPRTITVTVGEEPDDLFLSDSEVNGLGEQGIDRLC